MAANPVDMEPQLLGELLGAGLPLQRLEQGEQARSGGLRESGRG
jgi:hypothetical protein